MKPKLLRFLANLRFSIFILLLISVSSIFGTIIEQEQAIEIYKQNYPLTAPVFGIFSWDLILYFGLDHIYKTWWFLSLIVLFAISLILCSFLQQLPSVKIARRCQFFRTTEQFLQLKMSTILDSMSFTKVSYRVRKKNYSIFHQQNILYCYKGLIGRIAPIIVHFSLILVLFGTGFGSLFGFKSQEIVPKTESFHIQNILNSGPLTKVPKISGRINDFWITYTKENIISQFYSDLSLLSNQGDEVKRQTISVNSPLVLDGIYFYQTDWNLVALRIKDNQQQIFEYPLLNTFNTQNKIWLSWIPINNKNIIGYFLITDNLQGYCSIYNENGIFLRNFELNETLNLTTIINLVEILSSTGLQIKIDPGIPIIYAGFLFLMISTLISYITYSQLWIVKNNKRLFIGGNTNRAIFEFELEFLKFIN